MAKLAALLLLSLLAAASARVLDDSLTCMTTITKSLSGKELSVSTVATASQARFSSVQSSVSSQGEAQCARLRVKCGAGAFDGACTEAEKAQKASKFVYQLTTKNVCEYFKAEAAKDASPLSDVLCCATSGCNLDRALDAGVRVVKSAAEAGN